MKKEKAIVYCEKAFSHPVKGKTARGLIRFTERYQILSVIDSDLSGKDSGQVLNDLPNNIPIVSNLQEALQDAHSKKEYPTHFVVGIATNGGKFRTFDLPAIKEAIQNHLHVDSGLHEFLSEKPEFVQLAEQHNVLLRDIRKMPPRQALHFYTGKIKEVKSFKVAILGTDSGIGKRTTAWVLTHALRAQGISTEMIGTGQTAWLQGVKFGTIIDSLINDFVSGELEYQTHRAFLETHADILVIEGQSSLLHPAYPGGSEIIVATQPEVIVLQYAPGRLIYEGTSNVPVHPLPIQIEALELIAQKPVIAITLNHERIDKKELPNLCQQISNEVGLPVIDVLWEGPEKLTEVIKNAYIQRSYNKP